MYSLSERERKREREGESSSKHAHVFTLAGLEVVPTTKNSICRSLLDIVGCDAV